MHLRFVALLTLAMVSPAVFADAIKNAFPVATIYPSSVGILYPGFSVAAGVNGAAIPKAARGTAVQVGYAPPLRSWQSHGLFGSVAHAKGSFGVGAGYTGAIDGTGAFTHGAFAGAGYNIDTFSFGMSVREDNLAAGISPEIDAGLIAETKFFDLGLAFYRLNYSPNMAIAIGTRSGSRMNLELNVLMPPFYDMAGGDYQITLSAQLDVGLIGVYFRTTFHTSWRGLTHTVGLGGWVGEAVNLTAQYGTSDQATAALTFVF